MTLQANKLQVQPSPLARLQLAGFSFIELLVSLLILGIGVAALVTLQATFVRSSAQAAERNAALDAAYSQIEQLRWQDFEDLADGSASVTQDIHSFTLNWQFTDYFYAGAWLTATDPTLPVNLQGQTPHAKAATLTVSWTDSSGSNEVVMVPAWFAALQMRDGQRLAREPSERADPKVVYQPGLAPEVISIRLDEDDTAPSYFVKETSKPTPQVSRSGEYLQVSFDAVTYDELTQTQRIEDFLTLNCTCAISGTGEGQTPNRMTLIDNQLQLDPSAGEYVQKTTGISADAGQPALCNQCCRDHHDSNETVQTGQVYQYTDDRLASGNHRHYNLVNGQFIDANNPGDVYVEACRMRRIDGYYSAFTDWQLESVALMSAAYLTQASTLATYEDYVRAAVKAMILGNPLPSPPPDRDMQVTPGAYQLIGRGIYLDEMTAEHEQIVLDAIQAGATDFLRLVPFYEVNLTLLSDWETSLAAVASVTNEPIETIVDPENDYYGTYSRGRVQALDNGVTTIAMSVLGANAGVIGSAATKPSDANSTFSDAIDVTVTTAVEQTELFSVSGEINCLDIFGEGCKNNQLRDVAVTISDLNLSCDYQTGGRNQTPFYSCANIPSGWSGLVSFQKDGFMFMPQQVSIDAISANRQVNVLMQEQ